MSLGELLRVKSSEYELLAEWHGERASLDDDHLVACQAMLAVGIALREVAEALDAEWGEEGRSALKRVTCPTDALSAFQFSPSSPCSPEGSCARGRRNDRDRHIAALVASLVMTTVYHVRIRVTAGQLAGYTEPPAGRLIEQLSGAEPAQFPPESTPRRRGSRGSR